MKLVVFGGSGRTGEQVVLQALAAGHDVTAVGRSPDRFALADERLRVVQGDALDPASFTGLLRGQDAVISALGVTGFRKSLRPMSFYRDTAQAIARAMQEQGVRRILAVTSVGVVRDPTTPLWYRAIVRPLLRHKYADMRRLEQVIRGSGLDFTIVRPVQLVNASLTRRYRVGSDGNLPQGTSISRADVADFMVRHVSDHGFYHRTVAPSY